MAQTKTIVKSEAELIEKFIPYGHKKAGYLPRVSNCIIDFEIKLPFSGYGLQKLLELAETMHITVDANSIENLDFRECDFTKEVKIIRDTNAFLEFHNCKFEEELDFSDKALDGKIRFRTCEFNEVNFRNTTFNNLADFWKCTFTKITIFYKTDFNDITVFSASTFKEDVLFTYSLIGKLILFRGTTFEKGLDLSLAIISGKIGFFDIKLGDYYSHSIVKAVNIQLKEDSNKKYKDVYEFLYENMVSQNGYIPINNKRETFRIIKENLESQKNLAESLKFKVVEKKTLATELKDAPTFSSRLDRFNLFLNWLSNNHGTSYGRAFLFIIGFGLFFFYWSLLSTEKYYFTLEISKWSFSDGFKLFVEFLNPIHKYDYIENTALSSAWFYVFDFLGKTFVGYGIYQFIQAFRKYK